MDESRPQERGQISQEIREKEAAILLEKRDANLNRLRGELREAKPLDYLVADQKQDMEERLRQRLEIEENKLRQRAEYIDPRDIFTKATLEKHATMSDTQPQQDPQVQTQAKQLTPREEIQHLEAQLKAVYERASQTLHGDLEKLDANKHLQHLESEFHQLMEKFENESMTLAQRAHIADRLKSLSTNISYLLNKTAAYFQHGPQNSGMYPASINPQQASLMGISNIHPPSYPYEPHG
jgi:hypothetical protein